MQIASNKDLVSFAARFSLSEKQTNYFLALLAGESKRQAAINAGYSNLNAALQATRGANAQAALAALVDRYLMTELVPLAVGTMHKLMVDEKTPAGVRSTIAAGIMDRAGFTSKRHDKAPETKDASQMTREELQAEIDRLAREIDGRMVDVTPHGAPDNEPVDTQAIDLYE